MAINRDALVKWVNAQCDKVEGTPIPAELETLGTSERFTDAEVLALWHGAGLASQIGMVLAMDPGTFVDGFPEQGEDAPEDLEEALEAGHNAADEANAATLEEGEA